jgi:hypothetical protein
MTVYTYKVVPFLGQLKSGQGPDIVSAQLEHLINEWARQGWEFHELDSVDIEIRPGCLAALFGGQTAYSTFNQVIFRRLAEL